MHDVLQVGDVISHDDVILGVDLNLSINYVVSFIAKLHSLQLLSMYI